MASSLGAGARLVHLDAEKMEMPMDMRLIAKLHDLREVPPSHSME